MRRFAGCALASVIALLAGCQSAAPTTRNFSHLRLPATSREVAFDAADAALRARFPIASSDRAAGTITTQPVETSEPTGGNRVGDLVGMPRKVRRVAIVQVTGAEDSTEVWCKIVVEQRDTDAAQMFSQELALSDLPTGTAADRDAATTREQNEVWRTIRRDRREERAVLDTVQMAVGLPKAG